MQDNTLQMTMLLDFFGDLLTDKQREYFELYHSENLSLSEIAELSGISRQGVYDIICRTEKKLATFEAKTGVVKRFSELQAQINNALTLAQGLRPSLDGSGALNNYEKLINTLADMKG